MLNLRVSHTSLAVVRILFFLDILGEYTQLYWLRHAAIGWDHPWLTELALPALMLALLLLAAGFQTRWATLAAFVLAKLVNHSIVFKYHLDFGTEAVLFAFLFAPRPQALSFDSGWKRSPNPVPGWWVVLLLTTVWLFYFDSLFYKYVSQIWLSGTAFWYSVGPPPFGTGYFPHWLENATLMRLCTYYVLAYETIFPLILLRPLRLPLCLVGLSLHVGIAIWSPIPFFGFGFCALLLVLLDWDRLLARLPTHQLAPDPERGAGWGYALVALTICTQLALIAQDVVHSPLLKAFNQYGPRRLFGQYRHGVYDDEHFQMRSPILRLTTADGQLIPSFDAQGYPSLPFTTGRMWVASMFRLRPGYGWLGPVGPEGVEQAQSMLARYLSGWLGRRDCDVVISYKSFTVRDLTEFDFGLDDRVMRAPWRPAGTAHVSADGTVTFAWDPKYQLRRTDSDQVVGLEVGDLDRGEPLPFSSLQPEDVVVQVEGGRLVGTMRVGHGTLPEGELYLLRQDELSPLTGTRISTDSSSQTLR